LPKPLAVQFREEKKVNKALESLKPKADFLKWWHEKLKNGLFLVKEVDKKL